MDQIKVNNSDCFVWDSSAFSMFHLLALRR